MPASLFIIHQVSVLSIQSDPVLSHKYYARTFNSLTLQPVFCPEMAGDMELPWQLLVGAGWFRICPVKFMGQQ